MVARCCCPACTTRSARGSPQAAGFEAIYLTGAGLANSRLGVPDIGLVSARRLVDHVGALADVVGVPLVVDADTGFGNAVNVTHAVRRLERAGAAAIQLEDQVFPKKCGHFAGKAVIDSEEMGARCAPALDSRGARRHADHRADGRPRHGGARRRDRAGARVQGGGRRRDLRRGADRDGRAARGRPARCAAPQVANMVEGGDDADAQPEELGELGFAIVAVRQRRAALRSERGQRHAAPSCCAREPSAGLLDAWPPGRSAKTRSARPSSTSWRRRYAT